MEVPKGALRSVVVSNSLKPGGNAVEDYANIITISEKTKPIGLLLVEQYQFAGRTAANWFSPISGIDKSKWKCKEEFKEFLIKKYGEGIIKNGLKPIPTQSPQLIKVIETSDKHLVLAFTYLGTARRVLENYQIVKRAPQLLDYVLLHFSPFVVEIRASATNIKKFQQALVKIMNLDPETVTWDKVSRLTESEALELAKNLNAGLIGAKAKMTEGPYATKEVTANPNIKDLRQVEEYKKDFGGKPLKKQFLTFSYKHSFGLNEDINFVITDDGLNFTTPVSEDIISLVRTQIFDIKSKNTAVQTQEEIVKKTGI